MKIKDLNTIINPNITNVIYENHWSGQQYDYVNDDMEIKLILPVDEKTIKISVSV